MHYRRLHFTHPTGLADFHSRLPTCSKQLDKNRLINLNPREIGDSQKETLFRPFEHIYFRIGSICECWWSVSPIVSVSWGLFTRKNYHLPKISHLIFGGQIFEWIGSVCLLVDRGSLGNLRLDEFDSNISQTVPRLAESIRKVMNIISHTRIKKTCLFIHLRANIVDSTDGPTTKMEKITRGQWGTLLADLSQPFSLTHLRSSGYYLFPCRYLVLDQICATGWLQVILALLVCTQYTGAITPFYLAVCVYVCVDGFQVVRVVDCVCYFLPIKWPHSNKLFVAAKFRLEDVCLGPKDQVSPFRLEFRFGDQIGQMDR